MTTIKQQKESKMEIIISSITYLAIMATAIVDWLQGDKLEWRLDIIILLMWNLFVIYTFKDDNN